MAPLPKLDYKTLLQMVVKICSLPAFQIAEFGHGLLIMAIVAMKEQTILYGVQVTNL